MSGLIFIANPDEMPEGLVSPLTFEYNHSRLPGAAAVQRMFHNPGTGLTMSNGAVKLYAGSVNTVQDGVRTILHEYGHHSTRALNARSGRIYQTSRAESFSDRYARRIYRDLN